MYPFIGIYLSEKVHDVFVSGLILFLEPVPNEGVINMVTDKI